VQAILLDGHFVLEHGGRHRSGRFFNFNGTAGVWRRAAIEDAGGWQHDTLTEDLDLSYRAQLRGWRFVFLPDVVSQAEVPVEMNAFRSQQHRWAKGSIQTCRKLLPSILAAPLPWWIKAEAVFHLTANLSYLLMVLLGVLMFPALVIRSGAGLSEMLLVDVPLFAAATLSVCSFYLVSQREIATVALWRRVCHLPAVLALGIGLSLNNARAVIEALAGRNSDFARTPKLRIERAGEEWRTRRYRATVSLLPVLELLFATYFTLMAGYALNHGLYVSLPFIVLFQSGYLYAAGASLAQAARSAWHARAVAPPQRSFAGREAEHQSAEKVPFISQ
jgi:cellulose synthase/poly-beta-1,6-N-acetylglucosamine synthase-like glycosyltransferase